MSSCLYILLVNICLEQPVSFESVKFIKAHNSILDNSHLVLVVILREIEAGFCFTVIEIYMIVEGVVVISDAYGCPLVLLPKYAINCDL